MNGDIQKALELEYTEGNHTARQIDNRIWAIYAIYFGLLAAVIALVFRDEGEIHGLARWVVSGILVLSSIAQMALIGHLQSYSDRVYDRLRVVEESLGIRLHKIFEPPPSASERLWGFHKWLSKYRARDIMQIWAIGVGIGALGYGLLDFNGRPDMTEPETSVALAQIVVPVFYSTVWVFCGALTLITLINAAARVIVSWKDKQLETRIDTLEKSFQEHLSK